MAFTFNPFTGNFDAISDVTSKVTGPASSTNNAIVRFDGTTGKLVKNSGVTIDNTDNVIIPGNLTVNGLTTFINSTNLDVTDQNITVNKSGNDASAIGAGLTVERVSTYGSFIFDPTLTSKWKLGLLAAEVEVADVSSAQAFTNKTFNATLNTLTNVTNTNIDAAANIALTKLASLTASKALYSNASGVITASTVTDTELGYLSGVTSAIQTQIDAKVTGPGSATDEAIVRFDGITGKLVQNSLVTISDTGVASGFTQLNVDNLRLDGNTVSATDTNGNLVLSANGTGVVQLSHKLDANSLEIINVATPTLSGSAVNKTYFETKQFDISSQSTNFTAAAYKTYLVDTTSGAITVTLPAVAAGTYVRIKDKAGTADTNNIIVSPASGLIDGAASITMLSEYEERTYVSDGTNWYAF